MEKTIKISAATKDFNLRVQQLINEGIDPDDIVEKLVWDKTPFSLVRSARRNVPADKYELFNSVYKNENETVKKANSGETIDKYVTLLEQTVAQQSDRITRVLMLNAELKDKVLINLDVVLNNQLAQASIWEAVLRELTLVAKNYQEEPARLLRVDLHTDALRRLTAYKRTGSRIEIDSEDIKTYNS